MLFLIEFLGFHLSFGVQLLSSDALNFCWQVYWKLTLLNQLMISRDLSVQLFFQDLRHDYYKCKRITG